jgi:hypothetical protein
MSERVRLFEDLEGEYAAAKLAESKRRIGDFARSARHHGFTFRDMNDRGRPACVGKPQPSAMNLISPMLGDDMPQLGRLFQRLLSATAHSSIHGLARMLAPVAPNKGRPGEVIAAINIDARTLATELIAGPLAGHTLARRIEWFTGCDMSSLYEPGNQMLEVWAGVSKLQIPAAAT